MTGQKEAVGRQAYLLLITRSLSAISRLQIADYRNVGFKMRSMRGCLPMASGPKEGPPDDTCQEQYTYQVEATSHQGLYLYSRALHWGGIWAAESALV
jgi:hypothetical protein